MASDGKEHGASESSVSVEAQCAELQKQNISLRRQLSKYEKQRARAQAVQSGVSNVARRIFLGPRLDTATHSLTRALLPRPVEIPVDEIAEFGAALLYRLMRVGVLGIAVTLIPTGLLLWQNLLINSQNKFFQQQNSFIRDQATGEAGARRAGFLKSLYETKRAINVSGDTVDAPVADVRTRLEAALAFAEMEASKGNTLDLRNAVLSNVHFESIDWSGALLERADFQGAVLNDVTLRFAQLQGANLLGIDMRECRLHHANLTKASFRAATLEKCVLNEAVMTRCDLVAAKIYHSEMQTCRLDFAKLAQSQLENVTLRNSLLHRADFSHAELAQVDLSEATLSSVEMYDTRLAGVTLIDADLSKGDFSSAWFGPTNLAKPGEERSAIYDWRDDPQAMRRKYGRNVVETDLTNANLSQANLRRADLRLAANLSKANLTGSCYDEYTQWPPGFDPVGAGAILSGTGRCREGDERSDW